MEKYILYDDETYNDETVFTGDDHRTLLEICCRHSSFFACCYPVDEKISGEDLLAPFQITVPDSIPQDILPHLPYCIKGGKEYPMRYYKFYRVCPELCDQLANITDSVYSWINAWGYHNPEDLYFYREDGSLFFEAIVHEGECTLYPREGEDISKLLTLGNWVKADRENAPLTWTICDSLRLATIADLTAIKDFYKNHSDAPSLGVRTESKWHEALSCLEENTFCGYYLKYDGDKICLAFRMRYVNDEDAPGTRVALIDEFTASQPSYIAGALMEAEKFAKVQGCERGILLGQHSRQLWPIHFSYSADFIDDEYRELLALCGRYCSYISMEFPVKDVLPAKFDALNSFEIPMPKAVVTARTCTEMIAYNDHGEPCSYVRFFRVCTELLELMSFLTDGLYDWCSIMVDFASGTVDYRPEDPTFYRKDGSIFLVDVAHERMCILTPRNGEDVTSIVSHPKWYLE